jgi:probable F420-dependent oxidoreductase
MKSNQIEGRTGRVGLLLEGGTGNLESSKLEESMAQASVQVGPLGIWTRQLDDHPMARTREIALELEELGYGALWFGEAAGREALTNASLLLAGTKRIVIATGIANIYARDAVAMSAGQKTLTEAYPNRFLLGLGVSHAPLVEQLRGHRYEKPVATMRSYLDAMDQARYQSVPPLTKPVRVLAALGPKMLQLSGERADGAHPYNVTPEHTAHAREILGLQPYLCPEQAVVLETDPDKAREIGRIFTGLYLTLPNYTNNFLRLGFDESDFKNGGSNRLIDSIIAWGDLDAIRNRVHAHQSAGADHVCIQVLAADAKALPMREWRELASALIRS